MFSGYFFCFVKKKKTVKNYYMLEQLAATEYRKFINEKMCLIKIYIVTFL